MHSLAAALFGLSSVASAMYPDGWKVTKLEGRGCSAWPRYNTSSGEAGPWTVQMARTGTLIDSHGMQSIFTSTTDGVIQFGKMVVTDEESAMSDSFRCVDGRGIQVWAPTRNPGIIHSQPGNIPIVINYGPAGGTDYDWWDVMIPFDPSWPSETQIIYGLDDDEGPAAQIEAYSVSIDGDVVQGVYLGTNGNVRWVGSKSDNWNPGPVWMTRLLVDGFAGGNGIEQTNDDSETLGLLEIRE